MRERKHYSPDQKVLILRELIENNIPSSQHAEKYQLNVNNIYNWKKKIFEKAKDIFQPKHSNQKQITAEHK